MKEVAQSLTEICQSQNLAQIEAYSARRFMLNMDFFSRLNPKLCEELKAPPVQYNLYLKDNELNIIDIQNNAFVYPVVDGAHSMIAQNLALAQNPLNNTSYTLYTNDLALHKIDEKLPLTAGICNPIIDMMMKDYGGENRFHLPSHFLPSTTLFGLLGGVFVQLLLESGYFFHSLLLFEEDMDMFRISLYFVDYPRLFESVNERACFLFVKDLVHREFVQQYFTQRKISNNFLRLELQLYESPKIQAAKESIKEAHAINSRGWGSFDDESIGVKNTLANLGSNPTLPYPMLHLPQRLHIPICVVGNGASLDSLLPFIKENADSMIIFSCGTALKPLKNAGIEPDFQIEIERISYLKGVLESAPLGETTLLCGNMVQPDALALAKEAYLFMRGGSGCSYYGGSKTIIEFAAPYVGNAGFALAALLSEEVLICGLDCGYIKGLAKHAKGSFYGDEEVKIPEHAFRVQGNGSEEVYSDGLFSLSSAMMTKAIETFKPRMVLNLGRGAFIKGSKSANPADFELRKLDKKACLEELKSYMSTSRAQVLPHESPNGYEGEMTRFKDEILQALYRRIEGKRELFECVDSLHRLSLKYSQQSPFVGLLFEGSIGHILHTLLLCALHIPNDHIGEFYQRSVGIIESGLNKMLLSYKMLRTTQSIMQGIKP